MLFGFEWQRRERLRKKARIALHPPVVARVQPRRLGSWRPLLFGTLYAPPAQVHEAAPEDQELGKN
jgi:hypothetical protein